MPLDRAAAQTGDAYGKVFDEWVKQREPKTAILVVRRGGKTVFAKGHSADPCKPTLIASLSKPITGACIGTLVRDGKLSVHHAAARCAGAVLQAVRPRRSTSGSNRRRSRNCWCIAPGLRGNADDDPIYGIFNRRADSGVGSLADARPVLGEYLLKERLARHPGGRYSYSNTGYELLTAIIEEQTGRSYEDYCREAVFGKLGIAMPKLHPDWRMLAGAGGWFIPGPDYLAFLDIFDPAHPFLGDAVKAWIDQAQTKWTPTNRNRWYSLGVNTWSGAGPLGGVAWRHHEFARAGFAGAADQRRRREPRLPRGQRHGGVHRARLDARCAGVPGAAPARDRRNPQARESAAVIAQPLTFAASRSI